MDRIRVTGEVDGMEGFIVKGHIGLEVDKDKWLSQSEDGRRQSLLGYG